MEIRVALADAGSAKGLVQQLVGVFDAASVSLDADRCEVRVAPHRESGRTLVEILDTVEEWLDEAGVDSATVWLDGREHTLVRLRDRPLERERTVADRR